MQSRTPRAHANARHNPLAFRPSAGLSAQARARAQKTAAEAKAAAKAEADARNAAEEAKLGERLASAEAAIQASREQAMANVRTVAAETFSDRLRVSVREPTGSPEVR